MQGTMIYRPRDFVSWAPAGPFRFCAFSEQLLGLAPETVLRQAGLPMVLFNQEKILVSTEEFFALYRGIAEAAIRASA